MLCLLSALWVKVMRISKPRTSWWRASSPQLRLLSRALRQAANKCKPEQYRKYIGVWKHVIKLRACALTVMESERSSSEPALLMLLVEEVELVEFGILAFL